MSLFLMWLPWLLRGLGAVTGIWGGVNALAAATNSGFSVTPGSLSLIVGPILTSIVSTVTSFLAGPVGLTTVKKYLDGLFKVLNDKIDPNNRTDIDNQILDYIEQAMLDWLQKRFASKDTAGPAKEAMATLRACSAFEKSGAPTPEVFDAIAKASINGPAEFAKRQGAAK